MGKVVTEAKLESVVIQTDKSKTKWLDKVWVGHLKNEGMFERVDEELQEIAGTGWNRAEVGILGGRHGYSSWHR